MRATAETANMNKLVASMLGAALLVAGTAGAPG